MKVYLAIFASKYMDDEILIFGNFETAKRQIEIWQAEYRYVTSWEVGEASIYGDGTLLSLQANDKQEEEIYLWVQEKQVLSNPVG